MSDQLDVLAARLVLLDAELRQAMRQPASPRHVGYDALRLSFRDVRLLLLAAHPLSARVAGLGRQHARLTAAIGLFRTHLMAGSHPWNVEAAIPAALELSAELDEWTRAVRWRQACRRIHAAWPLPPPITAVTGLHAGEQTETRRANEPRPPTIGPADPRRGLHLMGLARLASGRVGPADLALRQLDVRQAELDLQPPPPPVDLRQLHLQLHHVRHAA